jgi:hypothetical protein
LRIFCLSTGQKAENLDDITTDNIVKPANPKEELKPISPARKQANQLTLTKYLRIRLGTMIRPRNQWAHSKIPSAGLGSEGKNSTLSPDKNQESD